MYRLRRYFPDSDPETVGAPILLIPPMMMSANVYDVTRDRALWEFCTRWALIPG